MSASHSNPAVLSATVVICTLGRAQELSSCLEAVSRLRYPCFEVLVVENGAPDPQTRVVAQAHKARYIHCSSIGLSRARNAGARACRTDLIAYLDDDARPHRDWLMALARGFADPMVMAVGGEELRPIPDSTRELLSSQPPDSIGGHRRLARSVDRDTPRWFGLTNFGGIGCGCSMAFRRQAFEFWPGFDERLGRGAPLDSAEETFSFFQLVKMGYRCVHTPDAIVWHPGPESQADWQSFNRHNMTNAVAYAALLWKESPDTRGLLIQHLIERPSGKRRRARAARGVPQLSFFDKVQVLFDGLRLYHRMPRPTYSAAPIALAARHIS